VLYDGEAVAAEPTYQSQRTPMSVEAQTTAAPVTAATRQGFATLTPRPTNAPVIIELVFEANIRTGPGLDTAVLFRLPAGAQVTVIGRNMASDWLYIDDGQSQQGWVAGTQIGGIPDLTTIPVLTTGSSAGAPGTAAPIATPTVLLDDEEEPTTAVELPREFEIMLSLRTMPSTCSIGDYESLYSIRLGIAHITITGLGPDTTLVDGYYNAATGEFAASGMVFAGFDTMIGTISFDGQTITVEAVRTLNYTKQKCSGTWSLSGGTEEW
jgi:uncharacterized protein YraI